MLRPEGSKPSRVIDDPVAGIPAVILRHAENFSDQTGILRASTEMGDLSVSCYPSGGNLIDYGENFVD